MTIYVDATELKNNISSVLNSVYFGRNTAVVKKHGKVMVKIVPVEKEGEEDLTKEEKLKKLRKLSGGFRLGKGLTPDKINKLLDKRYEEMLPR